MVRLETRLAKSAKVPWRLIEGEAILLDGVEGELIRLNPVGAEIWNAIDGGRTVGEIIGYICGIFDVSERKARRDVHRFIKRLHRQELVQEQRDERSGVEAG